MISAVWSGVLFMFGLIAFLAMLAIALLLIKAIVGIFKGEY